MIRVGIHENLRPFKAVKNDKGTLVFGVKEEAPAGSLLDLLNSSTDTGDNKKEQDFLIYCPLVNDFSGNPDTAQNNIKKIQELKNMLNSILLQYLTSDNINWDIMKNCNITNDNIEEEFVKQPVLDAVYANICDQFISMITPHLSNTTKLFRMIFPRKSRESHFPKLRTKYLDTNPFMEPMEIPKEQSRLKFTKWEMTNGLDNPDKIEAPEGPSADQLATASSVFNR